MAGGLKAGAKKQPSRRATTGVASTRFEVYLVPLGPTVGAEIRKTRPCLVISPDELNDHLQTVIVAPMTTVPRPYPSRVDVTFRRRVGQVALDQVRTLDKERLTARLGTISPAEAERVVTTLLELFS